MRIAVLGCGSIGHKHLGLLHELGHYDLAAVDPDPAARKAAERYVGRKHTYATLDDTSADAVIICTPTHLHAEQIIAAYGRGLHVICEKPISHVMEGGDKVLAAQGDRVGIVACPMRFHPGALEMRKHVTEQTLGPVYAAEVWYRQRLDTWRPGRDPLATYSAHRDQGGGLFFDRIHELDYLRWLFGAPVVLRATIANAGMYEMDVEEMASAVLTYEAGGQTVVVFVHLDCISAGYHCGATLLATKGLIQEDFAPTVDGVVNMAGMTEAFRAQARHWLACLHGDEEPCQPLRDGYAVVQQAVALYISAEQGQPVKLGTGPQTLPSEAAA